MESIDLKIINIFETIEKKYYENIEIRYLNIDKLMRANKISKDCFKNLNLLTDLEY